MTYEDWKQAHVARLVAVGGAFLAGLVLEAVFRFDVFGIALTAFFLVLAGVGALLLFQPWLERWYYHRVRAGRWEEY